MAKKHCSKHDFYVYKCRDCRLANGEIVMDDGGAPNQAPKEDLPQKKTTVPIKLPEKPIQSENKDQPSKSERKYLDEDLDRLEEEDTEIPIQNLTKPSRSNSSGSGIPPQGPSSPNRFSYRPSLSGKSKKRLINLLIIGIIFILVLILYIIPVWLAGIKLQIQLYENKAGVDFWNIYILNWWSTNFIINKVGLIGAIIGCIIMSLPPERNLLTLIGNKLGFGRPSWWKTILFWWTGGFIFFYFIGQLIDGFQGTFSLGMYMIESGMIESFGLDLLLPWEYILRINTINPNDFFERVFVYNNVVYPIISYVLVVIVLRIILNLIGVAKLERNDYLVGANISAMLGVFFLLYFYSIPLNTYDSLNIIQLWCNIIGIIIFFGVSAVFLILKFRTRDAYINLYMGEKKKVAIIGGILLFIIILPLFISIPTAININNNYNSWVNGKWDTLINRQREWTTVSAGLDMFEERDISNLTESEVSNLIKTVRQYDRDAALLQMNTIAQSPFETLGDSDIVYVDGTEYWIAPKTLKVEQFDGDPIKANTNMFDHVEGFLAVYSYNGTLILDKNSFIDIFGVNISQPIFFGEYASNIVGHDSGYEYYDIFGNLMSSSYGAFDDDILLNTGWIDTQANYLHQYEGVPDGSLTGLEAFWFTTNLGLFSYAINSSFPKEYLINRNIFTRVGRVLLPGLSIDPDPYMVFDRSNEKLYYAVSIYSNLNIGGYANSGLMRFLGICLVDVEYGNLTFISNPALDGINLSNDPSYNIWKIYQQRYNWHSISEPAFTWLKTQLRYPEELFETQLAYEYYYHVNNPNEWKSASQFYQRPENGDLFYIEFDIGDGPEFVGVDLVERQGVNAITLAGMYVLRHGDNFGEVIFYKAPLTGQFKMNGPESARSAFQTQASEELTLIQNKDIGNTLLYPLAGSLYYLIPVYSTSNDGRFQNLRKLGLVNAFNIQDVVWGSDAEEAYLKLNITKIITYESGNINLTYQIRDTLDLTGKIIDVEVLYDDDNFSSPLKNVVLNISIRSTEVTIRKFGVEVDHSEFTYGSGKTGLNYTILDVNMHPREGYMFGLNLTTSHTDGYSITYEYKMVLIIDGTPYEFPESSWNKLTLLI